jgi:hypothetical protein
MQFPRCPWSRSVSATLAKPRLHAWRHGLAILAWLVTASLASAQNPLTVTTVDPVTTTGYATFASHSQKVVTNDYGIFVAYLHTGNVAMSSQTWRLARSVNGGASFTTLHEAVHATLPPAIETDREGNVYLIHTDEMSVNKDAFLYIFRASTNFATPLGPYVIPGGAAQKYTMMLDEARGQIYYVATTFFAMVKFYTIGTDGSLRQNVRLTQPGNHGGYSVDAHYPHLYLDEHGDLYAAWTSAVAGHYDYYSSHVMRSRDGGWNWETLTGTPLSLPVVGDPTGPVTMINAPSEIDQSPWLSSMLVKQGKIHFAYRVGELGTEHYVRFDTVTGQQDLDVTPTWGGTTLSINSLDGFFTAHSARTDNTLYYVGKTTDNKLAVIVSWDNGEHWYDYGATGVLPETVYSITGNRDITAGPIAGMYTATVSGVHSVKFFRVDASWPTDVRLPATVSTSASAPGYPASFAGDGNAGTQWVASLNVSPANNNAWIQLDFGNVKEIRRIRWNGAAGTPYPAHSPANYTVAVSNDGERWTTVATRTNAGGVFTGNEAVRLTGRFMRLTTTKVNDGTGWSLSFSEFWAEGNDLPPNTRLTATITSSGEASGYPIANANDANPATQWVASLTPNLSNNVAWARLDLGSVKRVTRLKWLGADGTPYPAHSPAEYVIQVSNDSITWRTIVSRTTPVTNGVVLGDEFLGVHARYIHLHSTKIHDGTGWSFGLKELWAEAF